MATPPLLVWPVLLGLSAAPSHPPAPAPQEVRRLESGLDLAWQVRRASEQVHGAIRVDAGPRDEPAHQVGLARLLVDVLSAEGSTRRTRKEIDAWLGEHGAALRIDLDGNRLAIDFRCATEDLEAALEIARDLLVAPAFKERAVESAKNRTLARLGRLAPGSVADRALVEVLYGDTAPARRLPHKADVALLGAADLEAFHRAHVALERLSVALDGPLPEGPTELVAAAFAELPASAPDAPSGAEPAAPADPGAAGAYVLVDLPGADHTEVRRALTAPPPADDPERGAALLLHARYHTPPPTRLGRPTVAAELAAALDLTYDPGAGELEGALSVPDELALAAGAALAEALSPPAGAALEPARLEEARAGLLAVLEPAEDGARLLAALARARAGGDEQQHAALVAAVRALEGPAILAAVRAHAARARAATVFVGPAAVLAEALGGDLNGGPGAGLVLRSGLRQPRGDAAALALRARLLAALGGGERWAELATLAVEGEVELAQLDEPVPLSIARDLRSGDLLMRQVVFGQETLTVSTREASWVRGADSVTPLDAARHAALRSAEERQFFRLVRELARAREVRLAAGDRRLELWRGAERSAWFELGPDDRPLAVDHDGDPGARTELSEWTEQAGFLFPARMRQEAKGTTHHWTVFEPGAPIDPALLVRPGG